jgi:hypothetical protein
LYDFINGLWSGIPTCCTRYYIRRNFELRGKLARKIPIAGGWMWSTAWTEVKEERHGGTLFEEIPIEERLVGPNYTQCDKCYNNGHGVKMRENGVICRWLI